MGLRTTNIAWEEDRAIANIGEFVIKLKRRNNELIEAKAEEVLSYTKTNVKIPYVTKVEDDFISVNMGFCGIKKYQLVQDTLVELY